MGKRRQRRIDWRKIAILFDISFLRIGSESGVKIAEKMLEANYRTLPKN